MEDLFVIDSCLLIKMDKVWPSLSAEGRAEVAELIDRFYQEGSQPLRTQHSADS